MPKYGPAGYPRLATSAQHPNDPVAGPARACITENHSFSRGASLVRGMDTCLMALSARQAALIPQIYDAAVSEEHWPSALDAVAEGSEAKGAVLFASDTFGAAVRNLAGQQSVRPGRCRLLHARASKV